MNEWRWNRVRTRETKPGPEREGFDAYKNGDCPYVQGTQEYEAWARGYGIAADLHAWERARD